MSHDRVDLTSGEVTVSGGSGGRICIQWTNEHIHKASQRIAQALQEAYLRLEAERRQLQERLRDLP